MKLLLIGHTERYPVEQLQMQLFPVRRVVLSSNDTSLIL